MSGAEKNIIMVKILSLFIEKHIYISTLFFSIIISLWLFVSKDIISRDATLYIQTAEIFLHDGLGAAFKNWGWPFYSVFIAFTHKITGLSLENSAYLLSIFLEIIISVCFIKIYAKISFDGARLWIAMFFILTFPVINDYKGDIIRGYGFWAFTLMALYQYIIYYQTHNKVNAVFWQILVFIALLFRLEAIVFAVLAPFYFLFNRNNSFSGNITHILTLNSIFYSIALISIIIILFSGPLQNLILSNLPPQIVYFSPNTFFSSFNQAADNFAEHVLPFKYSVEYSHLILASGLFFMLLFKLISNFTLIYSGIFLIGGYRRWINNKQEITIVYYFILIALMILVVFIGSRLFVSSRYLVLLLLLTGLIFTQYLDCLMLWLIQQKKKLWYTLLMVFISIQFLDSLISTGAKKTPIQQSSNWLNSILKSNEIIACNEERHEYYTRQNCISDVHPIEEAFNTSDMIFLQRNNYSYLLLWVKHDNDVMLSNLKKEKNLLLLKQFNNKKDDLGLVYKIKRP